MKIAKRKLSMYKCFLLLDDGTVLPFKSRKEAEKAINDYPEWFFMREEVGDIQYIEGKAFEII